MADDERVICTSADLLDGGSGVRFEVERGGTMRAAFVVRHGGQVHAWLNCCAHVGVELDWEPGRFFDAEAEMLVCATHGALYDPATGLCHAGPCRGGHLSPVAVIERNGQVLLQQSEGD